MAAFWDAGLPEMVYWEARISTISWIGMPALEKKGHATGAFILEGARFKGTGQAHPSVWSGRAAR